MSINRPVNQFQWQRYKRFIAACATQVHDGYVERHHIYPRSLFPQKADEPRNLVSLTGRQHFIAHWMLHKAFGGRMTVALTYMKAHAPDHADRYWKMDSRAYERLRVEFAAVMSGMKKGVRLSDEARKNMGASRLGKPLSESHRKAIGDGNRGGKCSDETRARISAAKIGVKRPPRSAEHLAKLSAPKPKCDCPHCGKSVAAHLFARWHGDNCKTLAIA